MLGAVALSALAAALAAPSAEAVRVAPPTEVAAVGVQVVVPGAATSQSTAAAGAYAYRDLVAVSSFDTRTSASGRRAYGQATAQGVSLFGGLVTVSSLEAATYADGEGRSANGSFGGSVGGLVVNGAALGVGPNTPFTIPGIGHGVADERVVQSAPGASAYRAFEVGLDVHLDVGWHDVPAGTDILVGYASAGAEVAPPPGPPRGGTASPAPETQAPALPTQLPGAVPTPSAVLPPPPAEAPAEGVPAGTENPPPGGFTASPPIEPGRQQQLLQGGYAFPVAGGAHFSDDWGAPRSDTGFHQGIDLFAPLGTPVVAVQDGTLHAVGWNRLGGHRLWLQDIHGNFFYYAHLSAYAAGIHAGMRVHAGDVLAFVGNSGDAQGGPYHLHFEVHPAGRWAVPPFAYVSAWLGQAAPFTAPAAPTPQTAPALTRLDSTDISSASGLVPGAVERAAQIENVGAEGDTAIVGGVPAPASAQLLRPGLPGQPFALVP